MKVNTAWALYDVSENRDKTLTAIAVGTELECQKLQYDELVLSRSTTMRRVDVLVSEDRDGVSYMILADREGFVPGQLKRNRLK